MSCGEYYAFMPLWGVSILLNPLACRKAYFVPPVWRFSCKSGQTAFDHWLLFDYQYPHHFDGFFPPSWSVCLLLPDPVLLPDYLHGIQVHQRGVSGLIVTVVWPLYFYHNLLIFIVWSLHVSVVAVTLKNWSGHAGLSRVKKEKGAVCCGIRSKSLCIGHFRKMNSACG